MSRFYKIYESFLHRFPVLSQSIQTGILVSSGDAISQTFIEKRSLSDYDRKRTFQYFCVGAIYLGPTLTVWYKWLHKQIGTSGKYYGLKKMAVDQICFAPVCLTGFIMFTHVLRGQTWEEMKTAYRNSFSDILISNYKLWPAVQLINFYYIPLHFQVLYVQGVAILWNTYVCYKTKPTE